MFLKACLLIAVLTILWRLLGQFAQKQCDRDVLSTLRVNAGSLTVPAISRLMKEVVAYSAIYESIRRLEKAGLVTTWLADYGLPERGGRPRRYVKLKVQ